MKTFLLLLHIIILPQLLQAGQCTIDTVPGMRHELLQDLELSTEQKTAIKLLLVDYKLTEQKQKKQLRQQILAVLTTQQLPRLKNKWYYRHHFKP